MFNPVKAGMEISLLARLFWFPLLLRTNETCPQIPPEQSLVGAGSFSSAVSTSSALAAAPQTETSASYPFFSPSDQSPLHSFSYRLGLVADSQLIEDNSQLPLDGRFTDVELGSNLFAGQTGRD